MRVGKGTVLSFSCLSQVTLAGAVEWRRAGEEALRKRFVKARRAGELPNDISPVDFARFIATVMAGLAVQAVNGASRDEMKRTADLVLKSIGLA